MTITQWEQQNTGIILKVPKGTFLGTTHEYQHPDGRWLRGNVAKLKAQGLEWTEQTPRRLVRVTTQEDQYIELGISGIESMALKALSNKTGRSVDGPLTVKRRR